MTFPLFLALTLLLGTHGLLVRGDGTSQHPPTTSVKNETGSTTAAPSNVTSAPNPTTPCNREGCDIEDKCASVADCLFTGAICAPERKKCYCQVGYELVKKENKCTQIYCTKLEDCDPKAIGKISASGLICATDNHTCMCNTENWHLDETEARCTMDKKPNWVWYALAIFIAIILVAIIVTVLACKGMCLCFGCAGGGGGSSSKNSGTKSRQKSSSKP